MKCFIVVLVPTDQHELSISCSCLKLRYIIKIIILYCNTTNTSSSKTFTQLKRNSVEISMVPLLFRKYLCRLLWYFGTNTASHIFRDGERVADAMVRKELVFVNFVEWSNWGVRFFWQWLSSLCVLDGYTFSQHIFPIEFSCGF